jgi:hypothetical protein
MSVSCWFYANAFCASSSTYNAIISKRAGSFSKESYQIAVRGGTPPCKIYFDINNKSVASTTAFALNKWYHVVMVFDGTQTTNNLKLYVNGCPDAFATIYSSGTTLQTTVPRNATSALHIGAYDTADTVGWNGKIDEVRIYNTALTLAQVQDLYAAVPSNIGPVISLNSATSGTIGQPFTLAATVTDASGATSLTYGWSTVSGPASACFDSPTDTTTQATCSLGGSFTLQFTASDGSIATFANVYATITGLTFASWATTNGMAGQNATWTACPAGDGVSNLMKYALGLDPNTVCTALTDGTNAGLPLVAISGTNLSITYQKDTAKTDITYTAEVSTDLSTWTAEGITDQTLSTNGTLKTINSSIPMSGSKMFMRLRVTEP